jgi:hypothetical protein
MEGELILILFSDEQFANADALIDATFAGMIMDLMLEHPLNADALIDVTLSGIVIEVIPEHS